MAEIADSGGGGGGKHGKKGRKHAGSPRVDMTPMVDLAFLLLTFFVLTSNLNKAKTMELTVPKDVKDTSQLTEIDDDLANTIILDGNKDGIIYYYHGMLSDTTELFELVLDPKAKNSVRWKINSNNVDIQRQVKYVREVFKSGKFNQQNYDEIKGYVTTATQPQANGKDPENIANSKKENYTECVTRLDADLKKGELADSTYRKVASVMKGADKAPFFIVKWGGDAKYEDVINLLDELKIGDAAKYALAKVSCTELRSLQGYQQGHGQAPRDYPELNSPDCQDAAPQGP